MKRGSGLIYRKTFAPLKLKELQLYFDHQETGSDKITKFGLRFR